jgi:hypothetical protein
MMDAAMIEPPEWPREAAVVVNARGAGGLAIRPCYRLNPSDALYQKVSRRIHLRFLDWENVT